jgi:putative hydrolase of HD superfamily
MTISKEIELRLGFVQEVDKLKQIMRRSHLFDGSRLENTAEHSWHIALMAIVFAPHACAGVNLERVLGMLLVHDLVEIDAGDTFAFDIEGMKSKVQREQVAADRIFGLLPSDTGNYLRGLFDEFESADSAEANFARALDRLAPLLANKNNQGGTWKAHQICEAQVRARMDPIRIGIPALWPFVEQVIGVAMSRGEIAP